MYTDYQCVSASEMTYIVSDGALNSTHSRTQDEETTLLRGNARTANYVGILNNDEVYSQPDNATERQRHQTTTTISITTTVCKAP